MNMTRIKYLFGALITLCIGFCNAQDLRVCFVNYSSVGEYDIMGRKRGNATTDICFCDYSSVGRRDIMGRKVANETIDVCFVAKPSSGQTDYMGRTLRPTLNVFLSPRRTLRTHNVTVCSASSVGETAYGSAFGRYIPPTQDICLTQYSSVGQYDIMGRKTGNETTDICICDYPSAGQWDVMGKKTRNATTDIYLSPTSGRDTVDLYIDSQVTRKELVAILFKLGILSKETARGITRVSDSTFSAKVVNVHDGDTITVEDSFRNQIKVRLAKIDAPELTQESGREARKHLCNLIENTNVRIDSTGKDDYGRTLAIVYDQYGTEINLKMVKDGWAWHFKKYDQSYNYTQAEDTAKWQGKGLWRYGNPTPPWEWRSGGVRSF